MAQERYEVKDAPKSGTFGDVYKVLDATLEIERAFKKIRVKDDAERASVIREARLQVKLGSHPNIVQIYDVIKGDTFVALVMDWVEGQSLAEYLKGKGTLDKAEALTIISEVLKALEFAHSHKILHSDIKPSNVMRAKGCTRLAEGSILLVDFGVARTLGTHSMGTALGVTYPYAPPEFFQPPYKLDTRADLWATGVMLYQLVTGQLPFTVEEKQANNQLAWSDAITPCQYAAPADKELQSILQSILVPLDKRLTTAQAFREALTNTPFAVRHERGEVKSAGERQSRKETPLLDAYKAQMVRIPGGKMKQQTGTEPVYEEQPVKGFLAGLQGKMETVKTGDQPTYRTVTLSPFLMGRTPVTVGMWKEFCEAEGKGREMPELPDYPVWKAGWDAVRDHPMVNINWDDCRNYADWAGLVLPTEAQWEFAASVGDGRVYPWGNDWDSSKCQCSKVDETDVGGTAPVGSYPAGPFGLYDMSGNVREWCSDYFEDPLYCSDYPKGDEADPVSAPESYYQALKSDYRALRGGGAWTEIGVNVFRCAYRGWSLYYLRRSYVGFRLSSPAAP